MVFWSRRSLSETSLLAPEALRTLLQQGNGADCRRSGLDQAAWIGMDVDDTSVAIFRTRSTKSC